VHDLFLAPIPEAALTVLSNTSPTVRRLLRLAVGGWPSRRLAGWCLAGLAVGMLAVGYYASAVPVTLTVDGLPRYVRTHQTSVEGVLREADIRLHPQDLVAPPSTLPWWRAAPSASNWHAR